MLDAGTDAPSAPTRLGEALAARSACACYQAWAGLMVADVRLADVGDTGVDLLSDLLAPLP